MNTLLNRKVSPGSESTLPRTSMIVAITVAVFCGLVAGARWTLFEAPLLPEAVAASYVSSQHCVPAPEHALSCAVRAPAALRVATLHS